MFLPEQYDGVEEYVCRLYNSKKCKVSDVRFELFTKKYVNENKKLICQPCRHANPRLHIKRANYVSKIRKGCTSAGLNTSSIEGHGWYQIGDIQWVEDIFPDDVREILVSNDAHDDSDDDDTEDFYFYSSDESDFE